ncbi:hypothetical protein CK203_025571 [Vitis vinifera]|uniref:Integrase catalytic domain-containing protein n=1 Tax=Vitis vinifera TaxID=29760 RepID=A0A438IEH1_VITVI|nr:hypothetical protein CK203_025571 [Vitis vinifera]
MHGVPVSIVSNRDPCFTSRFWHSLQKALGTKLSFSTAFHLQNDGQSKRVIQVLEDFLRAYALDLKGRRCRSPVCWDDVGEKKLLGPELVQLTVEKVSLIKEILKAAQNRQKSYVDNRRRDLEFEVGDNVFLKVSPMKPIMRFGIKGKLSPRFVGPFELESIQISEDLTYEEVPIQIVDVMDKLLRHVVLKLVKVQWNNHSIREATWELEEEMKEKHPQLFQDSSLRVPSPKPLKGCVVEMQSLGRIENESMGMNGGGTWLGVEINGSGVGNKLKLESMVSSLISTQDGKNGYDYEFGRYINSTMTSSMTAGPNGVSMQTILPRRSNEGKSNEGLLGLCSFVQDRNSGFSAGHEL